MAEKTLEELNLHINKLLAEVQQMTKDFSNLDSFSHYNQLISALSPTGLLGALRENAEQKKLMKFLQTKIYKEMSFDEIGVKIAIIAEDLSMTQVEVQKKTKPSDDCYYGNVRLIVNALEKCKDAWEAISPAVAMEELKRKDGSTLVLGPQVEYWIQLELIKMDLPQEYERIKKSVKKAENGGSGCMVILALATATGLLAACSIL